MLRTGDFRDRVFMGSVGMSNEREVGRNLFFLLRNETLSGCGRSLRARKGNGEAAIEQI